MHIPGLIRPSYRVYPLVDTIADKVMAITEKHYSRPSTRYRDLVDLVLIARTQALFADDATTALESECLRRNIPLPQSFTIPDRTIWRRGYATVAAEVPELDETTLDEALGTTRAFLDPILSRQVHHHKWNPGALAWEEVE